MRHHRFSKVPVGDRRVEFGKDYDHILYSSAFRRLNGITQVVGANEIALFHNRLTHSLKVAQVARRIAKRVQEGARREKSWQDSILKYGREVDSRVVNAACIAHDLGHPPFGHIGERALQHILSGDPNTPGGGKLGEVLPEIEPCELEDSFEGNAQSFRIVTKLAFRESLRGRSLALDLTKATLAAILKYPWSYRERPDADAGPGGYLKWGFYDSERAYFDFAANGLIVGRPVSDRPGVELEFRTIEAQIMDWADDISYAIHDVEDFFRAGLIPLNSLGESDRIMGEFFDTEWPHIKAKFVASGSSEATIASAKAAVEAHIDAIRELLPATPYKGTRYDRESLHKFAAKIIRGATENFRITPDGLLLPEDQEFAIIEVLKRLTWYYVIDRPSLSSAQQGQTTLIRELFRHLTSWVRQDFKSTAAQAPLGDTLPPRLKEYVQIAFDRDSTVGCNGYDPEQRIRRAVVDYIVSLTEAQAIELTARLHGRTSHSMLESWFHM